ncbi:nuclear envelope pore membrane protein POM 121 [Cyrtonyx montezumae]|uniref:nuclear envelope pore membrane protein POM 121 n=1 Tax=Cyrtonyx montezumae TaxID=9017 RepID=UPI0032DB03F9
MAGPVPGSGPWARRGAALAVLVLAVAAALSCLVLRGALLGAAALGAAGAWCAMRPGPPAPHAPAKISANGSPAAPLGRSARAAPRRPGLGPGTPPQALRRRYPLPLSRSAVPGALPVVRWDSCVRRSSAWTRRAGPARSPVTVRIGRPGGSACSPTLERLLSPAALLPSSSPDPCAKETVLDAIRKNRKRAVEEEEKQEQALGNDHESKRRRHDSSGSGQSAFEPLVANGASASLIPKPGSLKRGLALNCPDDCSNKRSRTSSMSPHNKTYTGGISSSSRNAIASSYSSSQGIVQLCKRSGMSVSPLSSPASSRPQTPEWPLKKAREEELHCCNTSTPVKSDKELQTEKVVETSARRKCDSLSSPTALWSSGKRKREIQLLSSHQGEQLVLPPPPQLGYSITSEDLDAEKAAVMQRFNKVLEDKADPVPSTTAESTPVSRPLAFTVTTGTSSAAVSTAPVPASSNLLLDSLKKMQSSQAAPVTADSTGAAIAFQASSSASQLPAPAVSLESSSLPAASADTKPASADTKPASADTKPASADTKPASADTKPAPALSVSPPSGTQPSSSVAPPVTVELGPTPSKPPSVPKPNILFGAPATPPASQPAVTTAAAVPTTTPVFKPIFGALPKSESVSPSTAAISAAVTTSVSSVPSSTPSTTTVFKPIFGSVTAASSPAKVSPFAFKPLSQAASAAEVPAASTATLVGFTALPKGIFTTAATTATTLNSSTDATIKPVFSFGLAPPASTSTSLTVAATAATSTSQPFTFGGLASSSTSTEASFAAPGPVFQFGKPTPSTAAATTSVSGGPAFGQAPASSTAPTTTVGFSMFGSTTLMSSAPATTGQPALTFGSSSSAFGSSFSTSAKPLPYSGAASQPTFSAGAVVSQLSTSKPAAGPVSFTPQFSFGVPTAQSTTQPAFGSSAPPTFGTSSTQAAFGTTSVFSFGTASSTTASFGSGTQTTSSSAGTAVFGMTPSPFTFGAATQPGHSAGAFGLSTPTLSGGSPAVPFSFGAGQSGAAAPFGSSLAQSTLGTPSQSAPFAFTVPSTSDTKPVFGGTPAPTFGQSAPIPGTVGSGSSSLSFGTPSAPASGFPGVGPSFGPSAPAFSIGAGSRTGARQRLQARRQHTRKK